MGVDEQPSRGRVRRKAAEPAAHAGQPRAGAGLDGHLHLPTRFLFEQLERDAMTKAPAAISAGHHSYIVAALPVFAHRFADSCVGSAMPYWRDVGTIDTPYWEANMEMTR